MNLLIKCLKFVASYFNNKPSDSPEWADYFQYKSVYQFKNIKEIEPYDPALLAPFTEHTLVAGKSIYIPQFVYSFQ